LSQLDIREAQKAERELSRTTSLHRDIPMK
jgi:hypothetical protein